MQLVYYPNPKLLEVCIEAPDQPKCKRWWLAAEMWKIMKENHGCGLASSQVGLNIRMFVWDQYGHNKAIWNPVLSCLKGDTESIEGCLSIPGVKVTIKRSTLSILSGVDLDGLPIAFVGDRTTTRIWQHEIDHLDGKLIIDDMSRSDTNANRDALRTLLKTP